MNLRFVETRVCIFAAVLLFCAFGAAGQDTPNPSLGDIARKTRQEKSHPDHVSSKQIATEEDDGPDASGLWRVRYCKYSPCYELSVMLPRNPKWSRETEEPRPVLIPLPGHESDRSRMIRVYAAESLEPMYFVDRATRTFVQGWFARPEYFGQAARIVRQEAAQIEGGAGLVAHFTITTAVGKYSGLSIVASSPGGNYGFACVYQDEDSAAAASICDAIIKSAHGQALVPALRPVYPEPYNADPAPRNDDDPD